MGNKKRISVWIERGSNEGLAMVEIKDLWYQGRLGLKCRFRLWLETSLRIF